MANETTDVLIIGTGFGGSIPGYYLAAGGARVIMLERAHVIRYAKGAQRAGPRS